MDYNFTGDARPIRQINLGGQSGAGKSASQLAASARTERAARELNRRRNAAATVIQSGYKARVIARSIRQDWNEQFDHTARAIQAGDTSQTTLMHATRLLVFSLPLSLRSYRPEDSQRLATWGRIFFQETPLALSMFEKAEAQRWMTLVIKLAQLMLIYLASYGPLLDPEAAMTFLEVPRILTATSTLVTDPTGAQKKLFEAALDKLLQFGLHHYLQRYILSFPVDRKASSAIALAVSLSLSPFRIFKPTTGNASASAIIIDKDGPPRVRAIRSFCNCIMTIPLLPNRIPIKSVSELATAFPFSEIIQHILSLGTYISVSTGDSALQDNPLHSPYFLANLLTLSTKSLSLLKDGQAVKSYLEALSIAQDALPSQVFVSPQEWNAAQRRGAATAMDVRSDSDGITPTEEDGKAATLTSVQPAATSQTSRIPSYTLPIDAQTHKRLCLLISEDHVSGLFVASGKYPTSTRGALCAFLVSTLCAWPSEARDKVLNTIMYGFVQSSTVATSGKGGAGYMVGGLVREIWRGFIRGGKLSRRLGMTGARDTLSTLSDSQYAEEWPAMVLLCELYSRCLLTIGDDEFYPASGPPGAVEATSRNPLSLDEVISLSALLRNLAFAMFWHEGTGTLAHLDVQEATNGISGAMVARVPGVRMTLLSLRELVTKLLQQLHARDSRRKFVPEEHWLMVSQLDMQTFIQTVILEEKELSMGDDQDADVQHQHGPEARPPTNMDVDDDDDLPTSRPSLAVSERILAQRGRPNKLSTRNLAFLSPRLGVLNNIPFVIPFEVCVEIFRQFVRIDAHRNGVMQNFYQRGYRVKIRRGHIAEDGFAQLNQLGPKLKNRLEITFIDQWGMEEAGIDGGGVYKEFLTSLVREAFDTDRGLWKATEAQELYPNPHSYAKSPDQLEWYTFLGRMLGKALYEGILVDVKFTSFFLSKWLGKQTYLDDLASLDSLDRDLYRGLIYLKNYSGDVETDLVLNFTVTDDEFGVSKTRELIPGGADIPVTRENRLEYIYRVSHYRLATQISKQCDAFFAGLSEMIDPRWLRMMNREELRVLVCGTEEPIDLEDLRANTVYGGFHELDMSVEYFWRALESFDQVQRKAFLKFVTSSPNPPLLGFGTLNPKFSIRNAGSDSTRLPTASTCVNLLKLPEYGDEKTCRDKLVYAIQSGASFDLS